MSVKVRGPWYEVRPAEELADTRLAIFGEVRVEMVVVMEWPEAESVELAAGVG